MCKREISAQQNSGESWVLLIPVINSLYYVPDSENLSKVEAVVIDLSDKDGSQSFI